MVNTFIVSADFNECARVLDMKRLNKQITEATQLINAIEDYHRSSIVQVINDGLCNYVLTRGKNKRDRCKLKEQNLSYCKKHQCYTLHGQRLVNSSWISHPITQMWINHVEALKLYHNVMYDEFVSRGGKNNKRVKYIFDNEKVIEKPWWCYWKMLHYCYRASLLRKYSEWYNKYFIYDDYDTIYDKYGYIFTNKLKNIDKYINNLNVHYIDDLSLICSSPTFLPLCYRNNSDVEIVKGMQCLKYNQVYYVKNNWDNVISYLSKHKIKTSSDKILTNTNIIKVLE